ncbi:MAG: AraC family ligand binding domain-containing protein [Verrucomicrobiota bacterium]
MKRWDLMSLPPSTEKRSPREPGPDAPRVPRNDGRAPRLLFTSPECRAVILELEGDEEMGDHRVRERAVVQVVGGRISVEASGETVECGAGTLLTFEPGEQHRIRALQDARLLLILAPWPAPDHYAGDGETAAGRVPVNAVVEPTSSTP